MSFAVERNVVAHARARAGLIKVEDLVALTGNRKERVRRLRSGAWQEILPGVLGPAVLDRELPLVECAALLWIPTGALSHFSAARLDGIWVPDDPRAWVAAPFEDGHRSRPGVEVVRTRHMPVALRFDGQLRWIPAARTVVDLAQCLGERELSAVLLSAVRKEKATAAQVRAAAEPLAGRAGLELLARVTSLWTPERESLLEDALYGDAASVCDEKLERQFEVRNRAGRLVGRADVAVPELRLAFEADGLLFHSTDEQIAADQRRDRSFMAADWQTVRFREAALADRSLVRRDLRDILAARGRQFRAA